MGILDLFKKKEVTNNQNFDLPDDQLSQNIISSAERLAEMASFNYPNLDFSTRSIEDIDALLVSEQESLYELSPEEIESLKEMVTSYVLETGRRNYGGTYHWYPRKKQPYLLLKDNNRELILIPFEKVLSRLSRKHTESLVQYFDRFEFVAQSGLSDIIA